ncbi:Lsr2 family protein [Microbacterium paludicola]|nr:Lsr2 family protein [Microbacterium paludicola]
MARKIMHQLIDDIDGTPLKPGEGETGSSRTRV